MNAQNPLRLSCPKCSAGVRVAPQLAGKRVKCPKCGGAIKVPGASPRASEADPWLSLEEPVPPAPAAPVPASAAAPAERAAANRTAAQPTPRPKPLPLTSSDPNLAGPGAASGPSWMDDLPPLESPAALADASTGAARRGGFSDAEREALNRAGGFDFGDDPFGDGNADALPSTAGATRAPAGDKTPPTKANDLYRAKCPICESIHHVHPRQTGKRMRCGDCHSDFVVPPPPKVAPKVKIDLERAPTFNLEAVQAERASYAGPEAKSAAEYLRAAEEADMEDDPRRQYENPDVGGWLRGMFGIFADPAVAAYWLALAMLGAIPGMIAVAVDHAFILRAGIVGSALYGSLVLTCAFAILEAVANGNRTVDEWPVFNPVEWLGQYALVMFAVILSALPGAVFSIAIFGPGWAALGFVMLSIFLLFPYVLLSMLDNGSAFAPISGSVTKSITRCKEAWGLLYFSSMLLFFFQYLLMALLVVSVPPVVSIFFNCLMSVGMVFVYFSMIGRLAFEIGQSINGIGEDED